jgi:N4-gp56 family major capsid protein
MAQTNFAALTTEQLTAWSRDFWRHARNMSFVYRFAGSGSNSLIQRVTDLTKTKKGTRAIMTLLADMQTDGVTGDYDLEGNEEALRSYDISITMDQLRFANVNKGRLAEQKSVVNFRQASKEAIGYALADRIDQMGFLTLSGVSYTLKNNGALRPVLATGQNLSNLEFAADVTAPTGDRFLRWDATDGLVAGDTTAVVAADKITYKTIVQLKSYAKDNYIRGVRGKGGDEMYHMFVTPTQMSDLKLDSDFLANVRNAGVRGESNSLFAGSSSLMVDGVMIHEFRHVFNTSRALTGTSANAGAAGYKWGANANIDGARALFCGAQALALADIGNPEMVEDEFDYGNRPGISIGKIFGLRKPRFMSDVSGSVQDFGVIVCDTAQALVNP